MGSGHDGTNRGGRSVQCVPLMALAFRGLIRPFHRATMVGATMRRPVVAPPHLRVRSRAEVVPYITAKVS